MNTIKLGNRVVVSDPCYKLGTWCAGILENVKSGNYKCNIICKDTGWGNRVTHLYIVHNDYEVSLDEINEKQDFEVGVDSGCAGVFDYDYYTKYHSEEKTDDEWYTKCICDAFFPSHDSKYWKKSIFTHDYGFVSNSGYGDGGYLCFVKRNDENEIIAIMIEYISEEDED